MRKRSYVIFLVVGLAVAATASAIIFGVQNNQLRLELENSYNQTQSQIQVENFYQQAAQELGDSMRNLEVNLSKVANSNTSSTQMRYLMKVESESDRALADLSMLPLSGEDVEKTTKFINQTNAYCLTLSEKLGSGEKLSDEEIASIQHLQKVAKNYSHRIEKMLRDNKDSSLTELFNSEKNGGLYNTSSGNDEGEKETFDYPQLIYDGPFSDSVNKHTIDTSSTAMSVDEVEKKVVEYLSDYNIKEIKHTGDADNMAKVYIFSVTIEGGELNVHATVDKGMIVQFSAYSEQDKDNQNQQNDNQSKTSGLTGVSGLGKRHDILRPFKGVFELFRLKPLQPKWSLMANNSDEAGKNENEAGTGENKEGKRQACIDEAIKMAAKLGYDVIPMWVSEPIDQCIYVNMCNKQGDFIVYPDLVMVSVDTATEKVNGIEAYAYLANHKERTLPTSANENSAKAAVSSKLEIMQSRLAIIPFGSSEKFCYEFKCANGNDKYFVYVDLETMQEIEIKKIINEETGHLVM